MAARFDKARSSTWLARFCCVPYVGYPAVLDVLDVVGRGHSLREVWDSQLPVVMVVLVLCPYLSVVFVVYTTSAKMS